MAPRFIASIIAVALLAGTGFAVAQSPAVPPSHLPQNGGAGLRTGNITSTGATVPNPQTLPKAPRSAVTGSSDPTPTNYGICKGC